MPETPLSEWTGVGSEVVVYPNPAQNKLQITISTPIVEPVETSIILYTLTGQLVLLTTLVSTSSTNSSSASKTVSVAHLPAGVYVCKWQNEAGGASGYLKVAVVR